MKTVLIPVADGVEDLETVTLIDVLRRAGAQVTVASTKSDKIVKAAHGVSFVADCLIVDCSQRSFDLIVLPGGLPGADHLRDSSELVDLLKKQRDAGKLYAAICASPAVVLKTHGLLEGKMATCYPAFVGQLGDSAQNDCRVVVDGNCITSQGPGTAMEFSLVLVKALFGQGKRDEVSGQMLAA